MRKLSLALVATASILAGCSGGGSKVASSVPATPNQVATLSAQIGIGQIQSSARTPKYIPPTATTLTITVYGPNATAATGTPFSQQCVAIPAGTTTVNVQVSAPVTPVGGDIFVINTTAGTCVNNASGSAGSGASLSTFQSGISPVTAASTSLSAVANGGKAIVLGAPVGTASTNNTLTGSLSLLGAATSIAADPFAMRLLAATNNEGMLLSLTVTDGNGNTLTSPAGSGSVANCGVGGGACAQGNGNAANGTGNFAPTSASIPLGNPSAAAGFTITVKDNLINGGTGNHFAIAQVVTVPNTYDPNKNLCAGAQCGAGTLLAGSVTPNTGAAPAPANAEILTISNAPAAGTGFLLTYDGTSQDLVAGATITFQTTASTPVVLATLTVTTQALTYTNAVQPAAFSAPVNTGANGNIQVGGTPPTLQSVGFGITNSTTVSNTIYIPDNTNSKLNAITNAGCTAILGPGCPAVQAAGASAAFNAMKGGASATFVPSSLATFPTTNNAVLVADAACTGTVTCGFTGVGNPSGLWIVLTTTAAGTVITGQAGNPVVLSGTGVGAATNGIGMGNTYGNSVPSGPQGVYCPPTTIAATAPAVCYVAVNNSIATVTFTGNAAATEVVIAGNQGTCCSAGPGGNNAYATVAAVGNQDGPTSGLNARFNFGATTHIGMTSDGTATKAAQNLYVADFGNNLIRKISLSGQNVVTTVGPAILAPGDLTFDSNSGLLYVSLNGTTTSQRTNTIVGINVSTSAVTALAGTSGSAAFAAGATTGYPTQFSVGNSVTNSAGTAAAYAGAGLAANSFAGATSAAFANVQGLVFDPFASVWFVNDAYSVKVTT